MPSLSRSTLFVLLLALAAVWFGTLEHRRLVRPDEGRYAEIAREMASTGDFVTPRLNGLKYFEKPPLQYWMTALAFKAFGETHWAARLWPALTGFLALLLVGFTAGRLWGASSGVLALAVLAGMSWHPLNAHFLTLDMGVSFFLTATLCGFLLAQRLGASNGERRGWMRVAWVAMALAVLSKGLIGLLIPGAVLVIYTLITRDWALWKRLELAPGLILFLLVASPWFVLASLANPEFAHFFFIHEHFERFLKPGHNRPGEWWYFLPILALGAIPWIVHLVAALPGFWRSERGRRGDFEPGRLLVIWALFIFLFFSASHSKLPSYILPMFPALALLLARELPALSGRTHAALAGPMAALGLAGLIAAPQVVELASEDVPLALYENYVPWLQGAGAALLGGGLLAWWLARRESKEASVVALGGASLLACMLAALGHDALSPANSSYHLVRALGAESAEMRPEVPFFSVEMYDQTLPFYLKRTLTLVHYTDEMELGLASEPQKGIASLDEFYARWRTLDAGYALLAPGGLADMKLHDLPLRVVAQDTRRVIVSRR